MDVCRGRRRWGMVRGGGLASAICAAGLVLSGLAAAAQAAPPVAAAQAAPPVAAAHASSRGLPGPVPGCPPQRGTAAPALAPWPQKELGFSAVWRLTRG